VLIHAKNTGPHNPRAVPRHFLQQYGGQDVCKHSMALAIDQMPLSLLMTDLPLFLHDSITSALRSPLSFKLRPHPSSFTMGVAGAAPFIRSLRPPKTQGSDGKRPYITTFHDSITSALRSATTSQASGKIR